MNFSVAVSPVSRFGTFAPFTSLCRSLIIFCFSITSCSASINSLSRSESLSSSSSSRPSICCSSSFSKASTFAKMSLSTKSNTFLPSIISGHTSYFHSGFSSWKCSLSGKKYTPSPPFASIISLTLLCFIFLYSWSMLSSLKYFSSSNSSSPFSCSFIRS